ncbi:uncharacterized protein LOC120268293 isoform X2 [Dioscorea cayenensis subsp. rotundata]|uniref:Uncharacterized protein LOC120268293 isoform X2 n=1 Tax=Dioscorea cayennensis subsp. rotundata TaxID=55577 RepID=A0AB40BZJ0_DIOCR|nr:uncharacterized protein LOC120268293 isoform X2 [Dioscorea cayenensis subsp. rotundata]
MAAMARPDRSDAHLPPEQEAKIEEETREYFEGIAPKRHTKPSRSEYSSVYSDALQPSDQTSIPELDKLRELESHPQKLVYNGTEPSEEYVETEYYTDLNGVDKEHHTTGTGFIKMEKSNDSCFELTPTSDVTDGHKSSMCNPATNEWIPSAESVIPVSNKPHRSDA